MTDMAHKLCILTLCPREAYIYARIHPNPPRGRDIYARVHRLAFTLIPAHLGPFLGLLAFHYARNTSTNLFSCA